MRKTWQHSNFPLGPYEPDCEIFHRADYFDDPHEPDGEKSPEGKYWTSRPSIHMPRATSRITLAVTSVRVERLRDITENDAEAEGMFASAYEYGNGEGTESARKSFPCLWNSLNASRGFEWNANPWVWVVEFAKLFGY
ncbi:MULTISPECIES: hypothetical protein [Burkholderia]|uniref:Phage-like protein n=1 Tax=Burkholderia mayonis TaxID=1385591 RepID=A0A1B4FN14_9BURK|nr:MULTISPECIES: hypothetical protein [Burkholderia]AOJ05048.1 hypothetical protein WS70_25310 [Burkholderia mayonis]KVE37158.1 hypothetical protein WS69_03140 [Burkholderia sp. BDU5]KVE45747.1 hypothetical protein WS70_03925 [Burkholderia mayonis]